MDNSIKKRWISVYVENQVGVLSKISGLFSAKSYNMDSLTVGTTEDPTVSRMTIATVSDDETFELGCNFIDWLGVLLSDFFDCGD